MNILDVNARVANQKSIDGFFSVVALAPSQLVFWLLLLPARHKVGDRIGRI